ncbi:WPP domain-containing protein 2-like [Pyrus communis]|uniref:WPP domain-containing protein 2-like n=1 Tax=Pyrus communis TaxID=23211 RepID=UPI0035C007AB
MDCVIPFPPPPRQHDGPGDHHLLDLSPLSRRLDLTSQGPRLIKPSHPTTIFSICHLSFAVSSVSSPPLIEEDEIQILQVYSKEISKRMLDIVKSGNAVASAAQNGATESETTSSTVESTDAAASDDAKAEEY